VARVGGGGVRKRRARTGTARAGANAVGRGGQAPEDTRTRLLDAAERLFAEQGIQAVSLRSINVAAGARNASAVHYHFQSKENLLRELLARRIRFFEQERIDRMFGVLVEAGDEVPELRQVVEAAFLPTVLVLADPTGAGARYVQVLARAMADPAIDLDRLVPTSFHEGSAKLFEILRRALPEVPGRVLLQRFLFAIDLVVGAVARMDRVARRSGAAGASMEEKEAREFGGVLVDYITGGLSAPVSAPRRRPGAPTRSAGEESSTRGGRGTPS